MLVSLAAGCATGPSEGVEGPASEGDFPPVVCTVAYRSSVERPPETQEPIRLEPGDGRTLTFDDVVLALDYDFSAGEGGALRLDAVEPESEDILMRGLYQLAPGEPPPSAFVGGHGFTGLVYVHPPRSEAEAQYYCEANGDS